MPPTIAPIIGPMELDDEVAELIVPVGTGASVKVETIVVGKLVKVVITDPSGEVMVIGTSTDVSIVVTTGVEDTTMRTRGLEGVNSAPLSRSPARVTEVVAEGRAGSAGWPATVIEADGFPVTDESTPLMPLPSPVPAVELDAGVGSGAI